AALTGEPEAANDRGRNASDLAHDELGRAGDLVGDCDLRRPELVACRILFAAQVEQRGYSRDSERDVGRALSPGAAERVADDHPELATGARTETVAEETSRAV